MGCSITCNTYKKLDDGRFVQIPNDAFRYKNYENTAFLADVRNDSGIVPIPESSAECPAPRESHTSDFRWFDWGPDSVVWFTIEELLKFDYSKPCRADGDETYREFLSEGYFEEIEELRASGATHVMFEFNS